MATKVVVVDGQQQLLDLIHRLQEVKDYDVSFCAFGATAFKCIKEQQPDVVVIDLSKPQALGLQLISTIKRDPTLSVTPIVLCTAPTPDVQQLLNQLAKMRLYVLHAPCSVDDLLAKIEEAIRHQDRE